MARPHKIKSEVSMTCSMVNNNLPTNSFVNSTTELEKGFSSELVSYMVIHKAFTPLDNATNVPFSLDIGVRSNFGAYLRTDDQFSRQIIGTGNTLTPRGQLLEYRKEASKRPGYTPDQYYMEHG